MGRWLGHQVGRSEGQCVGRLAGWACRSARDLLFFDPRLKSYIG